MTRWLIGLSAAVAIGAACAGTGGERRNTGESSIREIPPLPQIPRLINLDDYAWGKPLFPADTESAFAIVLPMEDPKRFQIYCFDARRAVALCHGEGNTEKALPAVLDQIHRDVIAIRNGAHPKIKWGIAGQEVGPIPHPIGPGTDLKAWTATWQIYTATGEMVGY